MVSLVTVGPETHENGVKDGANCYHEIELVVIVEDEHGLGWLSVEVTVNISVGLVVEVGVG